MYAKTVVLSCKIMFFLFDVDAVGESIIEACALAY